MILWLASYPRSGNSFARMLFHKLYGIKTYSLYNSGLSDSEVRELPMADIVGEGLWKGRKIESFATDRELYLVKTHEMPGDDDYPAIYLVRDGRDALVSYAHFILSYELKNVAEKTPEVFRQTLRDLIELNTSFGGWGPNVAAWLARKPKTVVVKFEDMLQYSMDAIHDVLVAVGYPLNKEAEGNIPSFEELHQEHPEFYRKGQIGGWREEIPEELQKLFWEKHGAVMERLGYHR